MADSTAMTDLTAEQLASCLWAIECAAVVGGRTVELRIEYARALLDAAERANAYERSFWPPVVGCEPVLCFGCNRAAERVAKLESQLAEADLRYGQGRVDGYKEALDDMRVVSENTVRAHMRIADLEKRLAEADLRALECIRTHEGPPGKCQDCPTTLRWGKPVDRGDDIAIRCADCDMLFCLACARKHFGFDKDRRNQEAIMLERQQDELIADLQRQLAERTAETERLRRAGGPGIAARQLRAAENERDASLAKLADAKALLDEMLKHVALSQTLVHKWLDRRAELDK